MVQRILLILLLVLAPVPALAKGGMVSAADPRAAEAGRQILREGGSAADAAMAMMLALTVVEPQSSGIGGGGLLLHHDAKSGSIATIDGRETAPAAATPQRFLGPDGKPLPFVEAVASGLSVGVPGNIRLMEETHRRWGRLRWAKLFEPAIRLAEGGFTVTPRLANSVARMGTLWDRFPAIRAIYWPGGKPVQAGQTLRNPALAATLRAIADGGPDTFYAGATGAAITGAVAAAPAHPQPLTADDLAGYRAKERPPVCATYRSYRICGMGPPSSGATTVLGILGMLERFPMERLGRDSPIAWHLIAEAMQLAYADRDLYMGDSDFVPAPVAGLVDKAYLAQRSQLISEQKTLPAYRPGTPPGAPPLAMGDPVDEHGTTSFVAVDGAGDGVVMTSTVEGPFGSQLVAGGFVLNNELTDFSFVPERDGRPVANRVEAGKRPLSSMSPTIVYGPDGKLLMAVGSAGGKRIIMHVVKALVGVLDWKLAAQDAVALPDIYFGAGAVQVEANTSLAAMAPQLTALGHVVQPTDMGSKLNAIERVGGKWIGAADPRSEGVALAE